MSAHTPGPWSACPTGPVMAGYSQPFGVSSVDAQTLIAGCFGDVRGGEDAARANARLIAAAPDLYAALKLVVAGDDVKSLAQIVAAMDDARAALAKAEGR